MVDAPGPCVGVLLPSFEALEHHGEAVHLIEDPIGPQGETPLSGAVPPDRLDGKPGVGLVGVLKEVREDLCELPLQPVGKPLQLSFRLLEEGEVVGQKPNSRIT